MAATMRSLTSPVMAPLYWPTQARSDWIARRAACAIALAVSAGVCRAGRIGIVVTGFGLAPAVDGAVICAWAEAPAATNINVAVSIDLMTSLLTTGPGSIEERAIKHICLVGNRDAMVQGTEDVLILRSGRLAASRRRGVIFSWSRTAEAALLTMRRTGN